MTNTIASAVGPYLLEDSLGIYLKILYPTANWMHDVRFKHYRFRPDYQSSTINMAVEFDEPRHYKDPTAIIKDREKRQIVIDQQYRHVVVPYWLQLYPLVIETLFGLSNAVDCSNDFPNGFISKTCPLPSCFCGGGLERFVQQMKTLPTSIKEQVIASLVNKVNVLGDWQRVVPSQDYLSLNLYV